MSGFFNYLLGGGGGAPPPRLTIPTTASPPRSPARNPTRNSGYTSRGGVPTTRPRYPGRDSFPTTRPQNSGRGSIPTTQPQYTGRSSIPTPTPLGGVRPTHRPLGGSGPRPGQGGFGPSRPIRASQGQGKGQQGGFGSVPRRPDLGKVKGGRVEKGPVPLKHPQPTPKTPGKERIKSPHTPKPKGKGYLEYSQLPNSIGNVGKGIRNPETPGSNGTKKGEEIKYPDLPKPDDEGEAGDKAMPDFVILDDESEDEDEAVPNFVIPDYSSDEEEDKAKDSGRKSPGKDNGEGKDKTPTPPPTPPTKPKSRTPSPEPQKNWKKYKGVSYPSGKRAIPDQINDGCPHNVWPDFETNYSKGLDNEANFCYRTAVLQVLLHTPSVYRFLGKTHKNCEKRIRDCVVCALQNLMHQYWSTRNDEVGVRLTELALSYFNSACRTNPPTDRVIFNEYRSNSQSDAVEFLHYLLEHIRAEADPTQDDIPVGEVFDLILQEEWDCHECGTKTRKRMDHTWVGAYSAFDIQVTEPSDRCLTYYVGKELQRRQRLHCESAEPCITKYPSDLKKKVDGPVRDWRRAIVHDPQVLILRLKIFSAKQDRSGRVQLDHNGRLIVTKEDCRTSYEEYLDLKPYTESNKKDLLYRLDAVVAHTGQTNVSGHFIAAVRDHKKEGYFISLNENWAVGHSKQGGGRFLELQEPRSLDELYTPYILVYTRVEAD